MNYDAVKEIASELKTLALRLDDALNATKAAIKSGVVAGGGLALYNAREVLGDNKGEFKIGLTMNF